MFYSELPSEIKKCEQYSTAVNQLRKYIIDKTIAGAQSMSLRELLLKQIYINVISNILGNI